MMHAQHIQKRIDICIERLANIGFRQDLCEQAANRCRGDVQLAADWLSNRPDAFDDGSSSAPEKPILQLSIGDYLDCRDELGKWLEATIVDKKSEKFKIHFVGWQSKWDEWLDLSNKDNWARIGPMHKYSAKVCNHDFQKNETAYGLVDGKWTRCTIQEIQGDQLLVAIANQKKKRWFHTVLEEIHDMRQHRLWRANPNANAERDARQAKILEQQLAQFLPSKAEETSDGGDTSNTTTGDVSNGSNPSSPSGGDSNNTTTGDGIGSRTASGMSENSDGANPDANSDAKWWVGQYVEVLDTVNKWLAAVVTHYEPDASPGGRIRVHYEGWTSRWDEWLCLVGDGDRVRALGSALAESKEEKAIKEQEKKFRDDLLAAKGYKIVEMKKDGNCLFRTVAHQIFDDPERHEEVRKACYDHMEANKKAFEPWIAEDFDSYVTRQRQPNQWGDHIEIVALRELYNKNVEIYDTDHIKAPKPMGGNDSDEIGIMRLSFHGNAHYNSVVDEQNPPPLGDGKSVPGNLTDVRAADDSKSEVIVPPAQELRRQLSRTDSMDIVQRRLIREVDDITVTISDEKLDELWKKHDPDETNSVELKELGGLVADALETYFQIKVEKAQDSRKESLSKAYDDVKEDLGKFTKKIQNKLNPLKNGARIVRKDDFKKLFVGEILQDVDWDLNKA